MFVLALSGRIGSGKTTLADQLAYKLNWAHASYGQYVRLEARNRGLGEQREALQAVGEDLIMAGWDVFTEQVLALTGWVPGQSVVIEGIRHAEALDSLQRVTAAVHLVHIHLEAGQDTQRSRLKGKEREGQLLLIPKWESHSTEKQVLSVLPQSADVLLDATLPTDKLIETIERYLGDLMA